MNVFEEANELCWISAGLFGFRGGIHLFGFRGVEPDAAVHESPFHISVKGRTNVEAERA